MKKIDNIYGILMCFIGGLATGICLSHDTLLCILLRVPFSLLSVMGVIIIVVNERGITKKKDNLNKAYRLVYEDLCKKHSRVMALFNGTLQFDDVHPTTNQVNEMIQDIVECAKNNET